MATSHCDASGSRVVSNWVHMPGRDNASAIGLPRNRPARRSGGRRRVRRRDRPLHLRATHLKLRERRDHPSAHFVFDRDLHRRQHLLEDLLALAQLARVLQQENSQLKVIYTSGYSPELIGTEFETERDHAFLPKPYHSDKLTELVSTCLSTESVRRAATG